MSALPPTPPTTATEHLRRIVQAHSACGNCEHGVICPEVEAAQAALVAVAEATRHLEAIRDEAGRLSDPYGQLERIHEVAVAALGLLGEPA